MDSWTSENRMLRRIFEPNEEEVTGDLRNYTYCDIHKIFCYKIKEDGHVTHTVG
jgi:hypothetical protein